MNRLNHELPVKLQRYRRGVLLLAFMLLLLVTGVCLAMGRLNNNNDNRAAKLPPVAVCGGRALSKN